ncbi:MULTISPECIES: HD-GYP domain-containing protein [unclassified Shewanella]|uniref:HD-GYP domain-containing protein n=1 Tax=unclassified Shewanella TaxID=196818 RepID=UPI000C86542B|nr:MULTISPECIES: HD-GYP domain-containing protein [unclassified Shewanella]MDO6619976.1 HD-GYP domain-containing protein [Shewanella sp. 6_MG-2023]MDO6639539.1 HD-GYP domain-containing protein [Shewanella sp. 5_MG-2023]PMG52435.1 HD family phosphohydrolase [Shewanella sp. 10N.286.52.B9]
MTVLPESQDIIRIPVERLSLGMFVVAIDRNDSKVAISNAGQIKHKDAMVKLAKAGIKTVWVDVERSADGCGLKKKPNSPLVKKITNTREYKQTQAKKILTEAKTLVRKVLSETYQGKAVEVAPFEDVADKMLESVMDDADALRCVSALRTKDAYLLEHSVNVAFLLVTFGKHLGLDASLLKELAVGGILHDIGKVQVDNKILNKPGKLTAEEFELIKMHQVYAIDIMSDTQEISQVSKDVCLMHHEKLDGKGYPKGLKGDEIPQHGRMSCIVDIYDALTATRCYKEAMSPAAAFKILMSLTPFHLDQTLVYEFIRCVGIYPVGSLVQLSDERVGIVWESAGRDALHPVVKCFYSQKHQRYTEVTLVDLRKCNLNIDRGVSPRSLAVDPSPFY